MTMRRTVDPIELLRERFLDAMRRAFGDALPADADPLITRSRNPALGDFQANAAMSLGKALGVAPREAALKIVAEADLSGVAEPLTAESVAGPGFINIRLNAAALDEMLRGMDAPDLGVGAPDERRTVVVDLCGVNLAKQMHVGHLRSTVIGDALARLFERLGHTVRRQSHVGDWGLPIAMVTAALAEREARGEVDLHGLTLDDLDVSYREAQRRCDADRRGLEAARRFGMGPKAIAELEAQVEGADEALAAARRTLVALQSGNAGAVRIWQRIADITMGECMAMCQRLHANVTREHAAGESTFRDELAGVIDDLVRRGVATESRGALIVPLEDAGIEQPLLVRKADGGFLYATTDLAAVRRRVRELGADLVVYAVDSRQSLHFQQVFAAAHKAGYDRRADGTTARLAHAAFGTILGEDGRPFKTRSGENVRLSDLLDEAVTRADAAVREKNPELSAADRERVAEAVGVTAIKYADLANDRVRDYVFSFDRMLAFEGETGPYLQYALVRVRSIFRKAKGRFGLDESSPALDAATFSVSAPEEKTLALRLLAYPGALRSAAEALEPHRLCAYLFEVAGAFSAFFAACPVLGADDEATRLGRLRLSRLAGRVLQDGMETLGLVPLDEM